VETAANVAPFPAGRARARAGLVLTGGGARAAYQVGVVKAVRDILGNPVKNPFPILCGTSAGAINVATLAVFADDFSRGVANLLEVWENMRCEHIYRTDAWHVVRSGARWLSAMMLLSRHNPISLLDNAPLRDMLGKSLDFERIQLHIDAGALYAVCVTASGYTSGQSVSFFQGGSGLEGWERNQRIGAAVSIKLDYLLASAALPFIFPAVKVHREYFGDGSMRQIAPVSPALHLGADRVLIVGTGRQNTGDARARSNTYPSLAQIAGHALNSIFLDSLMVDIERLERINRTLRLIPPVGRRPNRLPRAIAARQACRQPGSLASHAWSARPLGRRRGAPRDRAWWWQVRERYRVRASGRRSIGDTAGSPHCTRPGRDAGGSADDESPPPADRTPERA
jgi:NTE family protein